jgi:hypothetical protein
MNTVKKTVMKKVNLIDVIDVDLLDNVLDEFRGDTNAQDISYRIVKIYKNGEEADIEANYILEKDL